MAISLPCRAQREGGGHVFEERGRVGGRLIARLPEVAVQVLQVGDFDVSVGEVPDVSLEGGG